MNFLEERIVKDGVVKEGNILKVDSFLNHQMDINLFDQMGEEFKRRFADKPINKIVTIEASGIGIACIVARHFGVPVVFAKKTQSVNIDGEVYVAEVESFTHKCKNQVIVSKKFLGPDDHVLVIDDFLANGCALQGLISIVAQAGGTVEGIGIAVEKGFQQGGRIIRNLGYQLESLAIVDGMDAETGKVHFREQQVHMRKKGGVQPPFCLSDRKCGNDITQRCAPVLTTGVTVHRADTLVRPYGVCVKELKLCRR